MTHRLPVRLRDCARLLAVGLLLCESALAGSWSGLIGFGTDSIFRGSSLTDGRPGWFGDVHYDDGNGGLLGISANAERPRAQSAGAQFAAYADRRWRLDDDWSAKLGVVHYESPWNRWRDAMRYNELSAAVGYRGRWRLSVALSADSPGLSVQWDVRRDFVAYLESSYRQPLTARLALDLGIGHADLRRVSDRRGNYGSAGLSYALGDIQLFSTLFWTDRGAQAYATRADQGMRWVTSLAWSF